MGTTAVQTEDIEVHPQVLDGMLCVELTHRPTGEHGYGYDTVSSRKAYTRALEDLEGHIKRKLNNS